MTNRNPCDRCQAAGPSAPIALGHFASRDFGRNPQTIVHLLQRLGDAFPNKSRPQYGMARKDRSQARNMAAMSSRSSKRQTICSMSTPDPGSPMAWNSIPCCIGESG